MSEPQQLDPVARPCAIHSYHSPRPWLTEGHHSPPLAWTRAAGLPPGDIVPLCSNGHAAVHAAIRQILAGRPTYRPVHQRMRPLVDEAVDFYAEHREQLVGVELP